MSRRWPQRAPGLPLPGKSCTSPRSHLRCSRPVYEAPSPCIRGHVPADCGRRPVTRQDASPAAACRQGGQLLHEGYGKNYVRLVEVKTKHDPTNLVRLKANIEADELSRLGPT